MFGYFNLLLKKHPSDLAEHERKEIGHLDKDLNKVRVQLEEAFNDEKMTEVEKLLKQLSELEDGKREASHAISIKSDLSEEEKLLSRVVGVYKDMQKTLKEVKGHFRDADIIKDEIIKIEEKLSTVVVMSYVDQHHDEHQVVFFIKKGLDINSHTCKSLNLSKAAFGNIVYTSQGFGLVSHARYPLVSSSVELGDVVEEKQFVHVEYMSLGKPYFIYAYDEKAKQYEYIMKCVFTLSKKREWMDKYESL